MAMSCFTHFENPGRRLPGARSRPPATLLVCLALWGGPIAARGAEAPEEPSLEYRVKAAFLMNFPKFVQWPPTAFPSDQSPIPVCTLGDDVFGAALDQMVAGESANGRKLVVQRLQNLPVPKSCRVLFVNLEEKARARALGELDPGVLTVGEGDRFLREGGMIAFVVENRRVRFDINQTAAENAGLRMSSQLLKVARVVEK